MAELNDKAALVTGAGQGIGQGIALALADQGAAIAAIGGANPSVKNRR